MNTYRECGVNRLHTTFGTLKRGSNPTFPTMFYLIQKMLFKDNHHELLTNYLDRRGLEWETVRFMPFIHEIEFTTDRKDVWCFGSPNMAHAAKKYDWKYGSMYNENHDFEIQFQKYGDHMLNSDGVVINITDNLPIEDEEFFARPTMDSKIFTGQIFTRQSWIDYVEDVIKNEATYHIESESKILITTCKNIQQEIRCWIVGGKVITSSLYRMGGISIKKNYDDEVPAMEFAQKMVDIYQPSEAFVLDICLTDNEYKIVEINLINAAGFYEANIGKLVESIEEKFN